MTAPRPRPPVSHDGPFPMTDIAAPPSTPRTSDAPSAPPAFETYLREQYTALAERLRAVSAGKRIVYVPNPGNLGDALIRVGATAFFRHFGLEYTEANVAYRGGRYSLLSRMLPTPALSGNFFVYGGGGAWCQYYDFGYRVVRFIDRFTPNYLVLPSTYEFTPERALRGTAYRRDEFESKQAFPGSLFCPDMALFLYMERGKLMETLGDPSIRPERRFGIHLRHDPESDVSPALRERLAASNADLSKLGDERADVGRMLDQLRRSEIVVTDRLHVMIASVLLDKPVVLRTGSYFKIKAIYDSCLKGVDGITLVEDDASLLRILDQG